MTVAEAISVLKGAKAIRISWNGMCKEIDPGDELMMDAYGGYQVGSIRNYFSVNDFEIKVVMRPIEAGGTT